MNSIFLRLLFAGLIISSLKLSAQNTLEGITYLYKDKGANSPLSEVFIKATYGGSITTNTKGLYNLSFDNSANIIALTARKTGYEIINDDELKELDLAKKKQQNIYLDIEGNTEKRKRELVDASLRQAKKLRDSYYAILDKGGREADQLKIKLEKQASKKFESLDAVRTYIYEKFGADSETIESVVESIVRQNLDHTNKEVEKVKQWMLEGNIDSVRRVIEMMDLKKESIEIIKRKEKERLLQQQDKQEKERYLSLIPQMLTDQLYEKADQTYRNIILLDAADANSYFGYAYFLQEQNKYPEAEEQYLQCFELVRNQKSFVQVQVLENLAVLYSQRKNYVKAKPYFEKAINLLTELTDIDSIKFKPEKPILLSNYAEMLGDANEIDTARIVFLQAMKITTELLEEDEEENTFIAASTMSTFGKFEMDNNQLSAEQTLKNSAGLFAKLLIEKDSTNEIYKQNFITVAHNLSIVLRSNNLKEAEMYGNGALQMAERLAAKNPDKYNSILASSYINLGTIELAKNTDQSILYYRKGLELLNELIFYDSSAYLPTIAIVYNNIGGYYMNKNDSLAYEYFKLSIKITERLSVINPNVFLPDLVKKLNNIGNLFQNNEIPDSAIIYYRKSIEILMRLPLATLGKYYPDLANTYYNLAQVYKKMNVTFSKKAFFLAISVYKELIVKDSATYASDLANCYLNLGMLLADNKQDSLAVLTLDSALDVYERVQVRDSIYLQKLAILYYYLGNIYKKREDISMTIRYLKESIEYGEILEKLITDFFDFNNDNYYTILSVSRKDPTEFLNNYYYAYKLVSRVKPLVNVKTKFSDDNYKNLIMGITSLREFFINKCLEDSIYKYCILISFYDSLAYKQVETINKQNNFTYNKYLAIFLNQFASDCIFLGRFREAEYYSRSAIDIDTVTHVAWDKKTLAETQLLQGNLSDAIEIITHLISLKTNNFKEEIIKDLEHLKCANAISQERQSDVEIIKNMLLKKE